MIHTTKDGRQIPLQELGDRHLLNIIQRNRRLARNGLRVVSGFMTGGLAEDVDADVDVLYGRDALKALNHLAYITEARRRGLKLRGRDRITRNRRNAGKRR